MTSKLSLSSSVSSATLVAINSISAATVATADDKQNHHATVTTDDPLEVVLVEQDGITSVADKQTKRSETVGKILYSVKREDRLFTPKSSIAVMKPDVGILSKDFLKNKGREQPIDKQFAIHRKKQVAAADVDVGILSDGRKYGGQQQQQQQQTSGANLLAKNEVTVRSLQSEEVLLYMCPGKNDSSPGVIWYYHDNLFNEIDGYFPNCSCPSPTTCGPKLCECLELDADGDISQCMDPFNQLCQGTMYIDGIPGPWSMDECLGSKGRALSYCSMLPCLIDGGSYWQCLCNMSQSRCTEYRDTLYCATSKCCQAQTDDEGREECIVGNLSESYNVTSFSICDEEMISRFTKCSFNSGDDKSIVECYCDSFSYGRCVNRGVGNPDYCKAMHCCYEQTEDDARLNCFSRFRDAWTGVEFYNNQDAIQESCVASGKSSDQCKCDIQGLSNCVYGIDFFNKEPSCDLFQCCQSQTDGDDEGRKNCLVQDEARLRYEECINDNNTTESCVCDKSSKLCSSGHSNARHCELSSCCQEETDDTGRSECIGNFTTSQPSSAPSEGPTEASIDEASASPTAASASALPGTSSASIPARLGAKSLAKTTSKMLAVTAVIGWLLLS